MAKRGAAPAVEPAPAAPAPKTEAKPSVVAKAPPRPEIIEWNDRESGDNFGEPMGSAPEGQGREVRANEPNVQQWNDREDASPDEGHAKPPTEEATAEGEAPAEEKTEDEAKPERKTLSPEQRRRALAALDGERAKRSMETSTKEAQERARAAEERAAALEAEAKAPIQERLRKLSKSERDTLMEQM